MSLRQTAFSFGVEGSKGISNTCMPICHYERNQFPMPSFKIASNLFIIFINKFNDSINMIYCAIFIIFIPRHPRENLVDDPWCILSNQNAQERIQRKFLFHHKIMQTQFQRINFNTQKYYTPQTMKSYYT